jgi:hypothetical protein
MGKPVKGLGAENDTAKVFHSASITNGLFVPFPSFGYTCIVVREQYSGEGCSN